MTPIMSRSSKRSKADIVPYLHTAGSIPRRSRSWTATPATRKRSTTTSNTDVLSMGDLVERWFYILTVAFFTRPDDYAEDNYSQPYRSQEESVHTSYR